MEIDQQDKEGMCQGVYEEFEPVPRGCTV